MLSIHEPTTITHRRGQTKFLEPHEADETALPKLGRAAASLCRLAFELAQAPDIVTIADLALAGLFEGTQVDAGAVLLLPRHYEGEPHRERLGNGRLAHRLAAALSPRLELSGLDRAARGRGRAGPQRDGRQHAGQPRQQGRGRRHQRDLRPIRRGKRLFGLIHLYSTNAERVPDPDDLEFTLAVADTVAVALGQPQPPRRNWPRT